MTARRKRLKKLMQSKGMQRNIFDKYVREYYKDKENYDIPWSLESYLLACYY